MTLEVTWPLKFVHLEKVAEVRVPVNPAGDPRTYPYGEPSSSDSLPVGYWFVGWMLQLPAVGEVVLVLRVARNGIFAPGHFISTDVLEVPREGEFHTMNSVYRWKEIRVPSRSTETNSRPGNS